MNKFLLLIKLKLSIALFLFALSNVSCVKEVTTAPEDEEIPRGMIVISSNPPNAAIYLNNKNTGYKTPDTLKYMSDDTINIRLKLPYFRDSVLTKFKLEKDQIVNLDINLLGNPAMLGSLYFFSTPAGAAISLNDSTLDEVTPYKLTNVKPGIYTVKYSKENYREFVANTEVFSSQMTTVSLVLRDTSVWVDYLKSNSGIQSNNLSCIAVDNQNTKLIGSLDQGLIVFNEITFSNYNTSNSPIPSNEILSLAVDNNNNRWIGTSNGLAVLNNSNWTVYLTSNSALPNNRINSIFIDDQNIKWFGTPSGLVKYDDVTWKLYDTIIGGKYIVEIKDMVKDSNGKIWFSTSETGVGIFNSTYFEKFFADSNSCILTNLSTSVALAANNEVWFLHNPSAGKSGGISVFNSDNCTFIPIGTEFISLNSIFIDSKKNRWICTSAGLYKFINKTQSIVYTKDNAQISSNQIKDIVEDQNGSLWITTATGGLNKFKP